MKPRALILRTAGTNCDGETAHAFELAGAEAALVHLNRIVQEPRNLEEFQILAIPGGFSYGDDIAAGRIFANQITHHLHDAFQSFVQAGKPIIGICNGFQVLVRTGLLPGNISGRYMGQSCTLTNNECGRFVDRWVHLAARSSRCIWTADVGRIELPVAHGEGKFIPKDESVRRALWEDDRVALVYVNPDGSAAAGAFPANPNGSVDDIAGICDETGLVFGLMPHPERFVRSIQHPAWRTGAQTVDAQGDGLQFFRSAVSHLNLVGTKS
jgi:phosphoribosylformylglycinamidine synthase